MSRMDEVEYGLPCNHSGGAARERCTPARRGAGGRLDREQVDRLIKGDLADGLEDEESLPVKCGYEWCRLRACGGGSTGCHRVCDLARAARPRLATPDRDHHHWPECPQASAAQERHGRPARILRD